MADLERRGHRERMRQSFIAGGYETAPDHNLLELYLSFIIPQKDVKQISYDLMNKFGSLENVFNAPVEQLMEVKGIKEVSAVAISVVPAINKRIQKNSNEKRTVFKSSDDSFEYCKNLLSLEKNEVVYLITLNSDVSVIRCYKISDGSVNSATVDFRKLVNYVTCDNASCVILTHNHPTGSPLPSAYDIDFTIKVKEFLEKLDVVLYDHIIVGKDECFSFQLDTDYMKFVK